MSATVILTSTVNVNLNKSHLFQTNPEDRLKLYIKAVLLYLHNTTFNIILVENTGYKYNELNYEKQYYKNRFEVITFIENDLEYGKYLYNNGSKGASEIFAINYAFEHSKIVHLSNFIIKITARYYIEELEEYLNNYNLNEYDCLTQFNVNRCEMVGSNYNNFEFMFNYNVNNNFIDNNYNVNIEDVWKYRASLCGNILKCKNFIIEKTQRGGDGSCFENI